MADPMIFTNIVAVGSPKKVKFKIVKKYRRLDPSIAPITSAK